MKNFKKEYPYTASLLSKYRRPSKSDQQNTIWHWGALFLFACLTVASPLQQLLIFLLFVGVSAIMKGPLMILWGMVYSFLVGLFPPLALILSLVFFLFQIGDLTKTWRIFLVGCFYYLYPFIIMLLHQFVFKDLQWFLLAALLTGLITLHFLLKWLYKENALSRSVTLFLLSLPYDFLLTLLPRSFKKRHNLRSTPVGFSSKIKK